MGEIPPGCIKIEFSFGAHGLDVKGDDVVGVIDGTQAAGKGVKKGWKIVMIDGTPMNDNNDIRPQLQKKSKMGKKYTVVFSKTADEMRADMNKAEADEAARKLKAREEEEAKKKREKENLDKEAAKKAEVNARKQAYADKQNAARKEALNAAPPGVTLPPPKSQVAAGPPGEGQVCIKYVQYSENFTLKDGVLSSKDIDEVYCLSSVMPGCFLHLAVREFRGDQEHIYIKEDPVGTWTGLTEKMTYYLYVQQDEAAYKEDQEKMKKIWAAAGKGEAQGRTKEGCSCLYGCPCAIPDVCLDFPNRLAVAKAHGMLPGFM